MENLPKDVLTLLALEMDLPSIISFCSSNKRINNTICKKDIFWRNKIEKERPIFLKTFSNVLNAISFRQLYQKLQGENIYTIKINDKFYNIKGNFKEDDFNNINYFEENYFEFLGKRIQIEYWLVSTNNHEYTFEKDFICDTREEALKIVKDELYFHIQDLEPEEIERYYKELEENDSVDVDEEEAKFNLHIEPIDIY